MNPLLLVDSYKVHHTKMYPENMVKLYSNFTPRKSRISGIDKVVFFGLQYFIYNYLCNQFNDEFFDQDWEWVDANYKRHCPVDTDHIKKLHKLGYLPIKIKALPEGSLCPIGVPCLTITNTHPDFGWLVNYLETLISCCLWQSITSATIAFEYKKLLTKYALETDKENLSFINWQGHDFSMRGMSSPESAVLSGMGHLTSFTGTDTIPAIYAIEENYGSEELIGASVPATEHSVMCMGTKEAEIDTFRRLINLYPTGILSVVSDTWNLWDVITIYLPKLKEQILAREGKIVIRPDSGIPEDIICGRSMSYRVVSKGKQNILVNERFIFSEDASRTVYQKIGKYGSDDYKLYERTIEDKGVIELLWERFGGTINSQGYKVLDPHIGAIYGDSITLERAKTICERLKAKGFASTNIVLGIGSYTYQYNTRDTFGFAMKATYGEVLEETNICDKECLETLSFKDTEHEGVDMCEDGCVRAITKISKREIWKDPITDDGTKKSAKGLLKVREVLDVDSMGKFHHRTFELVDQCTPEQEKEGSLKVVFEDGRCYDYATLDSIRERLNKQI